MVSLMKAVGIRELKNRLSQYVREASRGERILVTDRGAVVAELRPPLEPTADETRPPGLIELICQGRARAGAPNRAELYPARPARFPDGTALALLDEDRGPA
jgi:antitoxin (DNA-binding transcriptional repressor) of toxin-antitoxin stability system